MKIAINNPIDGWAKRWLDHCVKSNYDHIIVNGYDSNIIDILKENNVTHFFWLVDHAKATDTLVARSILYSAKNIGIKIFPDFDEVWHFDDKVAEKYLFESLGIPMVDSFAFYSLKDALSWLEKAEFPVVAKLRKGAGASNVKLLKSHGEAVKYCKKMFGNGITPVAGITSDLKHKIQRLTLKNLLNKLYEIPRVAYTILRRRQETENEKGYVYFQKFIPGNDCDYRIKVVGDNMCWGLKRYNRKGDFRASGSHHSSLKVDDINIELIKLAYEINSKLKMRAVAFDFIYDSKGAPLLIETSYCSGISEGEMEWYYNKNLELIKSKFDIAVEVLELTINE